MPVAPTYPGVYIEEIPSGVRTIAGVSTSVTAFIGYTARGPVDYAVHIFSFADFERAFGGLASDSPVSYGVRQFFEHGGTEAYVVRAAAGAQSAAVTLLNRTGAGALSALIVEAASQGTWGNQLRVEVDYDTVSPASLFNLKVTELIDRDGQLLPGRVEVSRNLSMDRFAPTYAVDKIKAGSQLVTVTRPDEVLAAVTKGTSRSGTIESTDFDALKPTEKTTRLSVSLNGEAPIEFDLSTPAAQLFAAADTLDQRLDKLKDRIQTAVTDRGGAITVTHAAAGQKFITATSELPLTAPNKERSSVHFGGEGAVLLKLGTANGGIETDGAAALRPVQTGTVGGDLGTLATAITPAAADGKIKIERMLGTTATGSLDLSLWTGGAKPTTVGALLSAIQKALSESTNPLMAGATASFVGGKIRLVPGGNDPNPWFQISGATGDATTATEAKLTAAAGADPNLARYGPGVGATQFAQKAARSGNSGAEPTATELRGKEADKTGLYALEDADIFNILCLPGVKDLTVLSEAVAYCERRRAFLIVNLPGDLEAADDPAKSLEEAKKWLTNNASLRNRNAAAYFPRLRAPDPLANSIVKPFDASGAIAGIYARTDAGPGVWKAPAGTDATFSGVTGVTVPLTDRENGVLNPLGLNCIRTFPIYGTVAWGARTLKGADQQADEYKYIPVRRFALYLEESLYRGTQWVVFQPNDEPLWAQIRLNVGAFLHTLFRQGAFQGRTPRDAYFVKCDKDTTTQNDIDLGRVNIVVGFAPLKPAEFVIIKIQQIAGAIQT
jgi:hypothetical protein